MLIVTLRMNLAWYWIGYGSAARQIEEFIRLTRSVGSFRLHQASICIINRVSKVSLLFGKSEFCAPIPERRSLSFTDMFHSKDCGRLTPTKRNPSVPKVCQSCTSCCSNSVESEHSRRVRGVPCRAETGENANHSPNADQKGVSLEILRIL